jgi:hypothetical protein
MIIDQYCNDQRFFRLKTRHMPPWLGCVVIFQLVIKKIAGQADLSIFREMTRFIHEVLSSHERLIYRQTDAFVRLLVTQCI